MKRKPKPPAKWTREMRAATAEKSTREIAYHKQSAMAAQALASPLADKIEEELWGHIQPKQIRRRGHWWVE